VQHGSIQSAYNAAVEISCIETGVPSVRPLFVRGPVAAAGAFRFYRIPVVTFTARIFLGSSWHRPLCTTAQIVRHTRCLSRLHTQTRVSIVLDAREQR